MMCQQDHGKHWESTYSIIDLFPSDPWNDNDHIIQNHRRPQDHIWRVWCASSTDDRPRATVYESRIPGLLPTTIRSRSSTLRRDILRAMASSKPWSRQSRASWLEPRTPKVTHRWQCWSTDPHRSRQVLPALQSSSTAEDTKIWSQQGNTSTPSKTSPVKYCCLTRTK